MEARRISVIVPTLNEEATIAATLEDLSKSGFSEVIVVDAGSRDSTRSLAAGRATRLLVEGGGLARQLNRGAREASGDVLLFHFADLRLPAGAVDQLREALRAPEVVGGAFRLGFDSRRAVYRLIALFANLRNRLGLGPFGDQGIFVRRESFERLGGFAPEAALEDLDLVRRLKRAGRFVILPGPVRSSVRRWEEDGLLATTFNHWRGSFYYLLGARKRAGALKRGLQTRSGRTPRRFR